MDYLQGIWYHLIEDTETNSFLTRNRNKLTTLEINQRGGGGESPTHGTQARVNPARLPLSGVGSGRWSQVRGWWLAGSCWATQERKGGAGRLGRVGVLLGFGPNRLRELEILFYFQFLLKICKPN
jgi:hypothetical protein